MILREQKIYLVSGVSSGMGKAFAQLMYKQRHKVIGIVRNKSAVNAEDFHDLIECDYACPEKIETIFKTFDIKIDSFVNFAGILPGKSFQEYDSESLRELTNVNLITPMLIIKCIEKNINNGGSIILFSSVSAQKGSYDDAYAATKGAIHSLIKSLALKFAPDVRVLGLAPGMCNDTRMTDDLIDGRYEHNLETIPLKKAVEVNDIAELVYFLSSKSAQSITGAVLDVNGGQYLR
jgi:NAD(P)-dependent dehydrogenase (short-subunit alcohol dehydrogenase family)